MTSLEEINDPTKAMNAALILFDKATLATIEQGYNAWQNGGIQGAQNAGQSAGVQSGGNHNGLVVVPGIANQNGTGNVVAARAEGTRNENQARDVAYLQTQLLIAQKEEAGIQLQAEEFDFMAAAGDLDEIEEVNANCILMVNLQHASTFGTHLDKAFVYDKDGSAENDNHVTSVAPSMVQSGGAENRPPMLEKDMYDSWRSRMELYILNRQHGRMILESVEHGPLLWPFVTEDGVTRLKKYSELSSAEAIQADCDVKATNIVLQALPLEIYALFSTHKVAKDLWERILMLMQGTSLTKQERECKLYDAFDKFAYQKGETLHDFYLRFSLLLNDINMYNMKLEQFQVNTKFLNTLPPEWSKFVTDVKLFVSQGSSSSNLSICYPMNDTSSTVNHNAFIASAPQIDYPPITHHPSKFSSPETRLVVPVFQRGDDPIDAINHIMSFLTSVVTS
nr:hypothetical protein [Tanacetum cinerariifolium]